MRRAALVLLLWLAAAAGGVAQDVEVVASVDRTEPRENESFTYVLRAEGRVRGQPDISPLLELFEVLSSSESTRIQIVGGRAEQVVEWIYQLMPKQAGKALIPPIEVGGTFSNPVEIEVLPAVADADVPGDIFLEVEVSPERVYVQSQLVYTLRLFVGTMTGRATITPPRITGGEAIVERLGDDREYRATRGNRDFSVRERRFAIFPQQAGKLTIGPATFEAMVLPPRGFSRLERHESEPVEIDVLPAVPPPASHPRAAWLPAHRLELDERWSTDPPELVVGVPTTRTLTIEAEGLLETQLPELELPQASGVRMYADRPELDRTVTGSGLVARRVERYAVLPQAPGDAELPGVELPWFDVDTGRWEIASVPSRVLDVKPGSAPDPLPDPQPAPSADQPAAAPASPPPPAANPWPLVSAALGVGWAVTLLLWWRSSRPLRPRAAQDAAPPKRPTARGALKRLKAACDRNDPEAARTALLDWAAERFPDDVPRSLGALAARLPEDAAAAVIELEGALYAPRGRDWNGRALAAALDARSTPGHGRPARRQDDPLLPLYR
ncbi:MAG TPA: BatD family protein [Gammaproteobacteria bacterium]